LARSATNASGFRLASGLCCAAIVHANMSVGVIGLGYVGLPLVVGFAEAGEDVVAVDVDPRKVAAIKAGESYIEDIASERLQAVLPKIQATSHYQPLARTDAVLICVPTPLTANRE